MLIPKDTYCFFFFPTFLFVREKKMEFLKFMQLLPSRATKSRGDLTYIGKYQLVAYLSDWEKVVRMIF